MATPPACVSNRGNLGNLGGEETLYSISVLLSLVLLFNFGSVSKYSVDTRI